MYLFWITIGGIAHMVERSLRMREAQGSIPCTSIFHRYNILNFFKTQKYNYLNFRKKCIYFGSPLGVQLIWQSARFACERHRVQFPAPPFFIDITFSIFFKTHKYNYLNLRKKCINFTSSLRVQLIWQSAHFACERYRVQCTSIFYKFQQFGEKGNLGKSRVTQHIAHDIYMKMLIINDT